MRNLPTILAATQPSFRMKNYSGKKELNFFPLPLADLLNLTKSACLTIDELLQLTHVKIFLGISKLVKSHCTSFVTGLGLETRFMQDVLLSPIVPSSWTDCHPCTNTVLRSIMTVIFTLLIVDPVSQKKSYTKSTKI